MTEKNLDFDTIIERKNTNSLKYDFAKRCGMPEDLLPLWVADMDFRVSSYIEEAVHHCACHGIYGYSEAQESYFHTVQAWMKRHYDWEVEARWLVKTPGIVFALAAIVRAFTEEGDGILIQQPVYYPFSDVIKNNHRRIVDNTLLPDENGKYRIDFEDFERKVVQEKVKLFLLCNPQNPTGRVFTKEELERMGDICVKHNVIVASDEIHADFVFEGTHQVFANVRENFQDIAIICTSPSKTFNIAGLQVSNIFIPNQKLRRRFRKEIKASGYSQLNTVGLAACEAAYRDGEEWYQKVYEYIDNNIGYTLNFVAERIPQIQVARPEGTYLVWMDFRGLGLPDKELERLVIDRAKLWLDNGTMFGETGRGFWRINVACPRKLLEKALTSLEQAIRQKMQITR